MNKKHNFKVAFLLFIPIALVFVFAFNYKSFRDLYLAATYTPTSVTESVEKSLGLTDYAVRIYRASHPEITTDFSQFSSICYEGQDGDTISIKGCYSDGVIYVYDIEYSELSGIVESTTAHELLHAVWSRLSSAQKSTLTPILEEFYENSSEEFKNTLMSYPDEQILEEIYVRSATQVADLPETLESHIAQYFTDQDYVVSYYSSYSDAFLRISSELEELETRLATLKTDIETLSSQYNSDLSTLKSDIDSFNSCANTAGCYNSTTFWSARNALVTRQQTLESLVVTINSKIDEYNSLVASYNANILHSNQLETIINPNLSLETIN